MHVRRSLVAQLHSGDSYALVLALLLASVFLAIVAPEETWGRVLRDAVLAGTVVIAYWTATARRAFLVPRVVVPSLALVFVVVGNDGSTGEHLYFSLVAISTTGFGDLAPASDVGRALVALEIVLGQLYLVTVLAVIVTAATRRQLRQGRDEPPAA